MTKVLILIFGNGDAIKITHDDPTETTEATLELMPPPPRGGRILIVDDERRIRLALRSCLEAEGYEVEEARDGAEAIRVVLDTRPDLMLLDLAMPRLDGMGALRELRARYADVMPRVVVLTAWGSPAVEEEAYLCGVKDFLNKPPVPVVLRAVVERVLRETTSPPTRPPGDDNGDDDDEGQAFGHLFFG
jgi:DNA-binding response OmpR family regulator